MWTCRGCLVDLSLKQADPQIDYDGFYFDCPICNERNRLINMGEPGDPLLLAQEAIDWKKRPFVK